MSAPGERAVSEGAKAGAMLPYGRQSIDEEDIEAVVRVLRSDWLTQGPMIEAFERGMARYCGAKHAVAVSSGTAGLHLACLAAGLGSGDKLWTSPNTFVASANCALYCGAGVDFVDIDPRTYNLSAGELARRLDEAAGSGGSPKVMVPVAFAGQSCEMAEIGALAKRHGVTVIEDASHAVGGRYRNEPVGSCRHSDMAVFSFHPVKIMTTGEGGMVLTNRDDLYERLMRLRTHGITRNPGQMRSECEGPWYYEQLELGFNYRISDLQAALGMSQLKRLDAFVSRRRELAARYGEALAGLPVRCPWQHPDTESSFHLYVIRLMRDRCGHGHKEVFEGLRERGIGVNLHYIPVHRQPYYRDLGFQRGDFPEAEAYYAEAISLPLFFGLAESDQDRVVEALKAVLS